MKNKMPSDEEKAAQVKAALLDGVALADQLITAPRTPIMSAVALSHATALIHSVLAQSRGGEADKWLEMFCDGLSSTLDKLGHPVLVGFTRIPSPDGKEPEPFIAPKCDDPGCEVCHGDEDSTDADESSNDGGEA